MLLIKLDYTLLALAVLGIVSGFGFGFGKTKTDSKSSPNGNEIEAKDQTASPTNPSTAVKPLVTNRFTPTFPSITDNPINNPTPLSKVKPPSSKAIKIMNTLGLTKKAKKSINPISIPNDLSGKTDDEIMKYASMLMTQRRRLQRKMTKWMVYNGILMVINQQLGTSSLVQGASAGLTWLNTSYRETINEDWIIHQKQLADFIVEYKNLKKVDTKTLPKSKRVGAPVIQMEYAKGRFVKFPVWINNKDEPLPKAIEVHNPVSIYRNWVMRR